MEGENLILLKVLMLKSVNYSVVNVLLSFTLKTKPWLKISLTNLDQYQNLPSLFHVILINSPYFVVQQ